MALEINKPTDEHRNNKRVGAVVIGRNEGKRLERCLQSVVPQVAHVVYVDSGSEDGSVNFAKSLGVEVVELDMSIPFSAARARNAGIEVLSRKPSVAFVQFVDGDCELQEGWISTAQSFLDNTPEAAVAFGRVREKFPNATIFNKLADEEWQGPIGPVKECGGISLMRLDPIKELGGFDANFIAAEEPELCLRIRKNGWQVWRLDTEMVLHDIAMTKISQWWLRCKRNGFASAYCHNVHGGPPERLGTLSTYRAIGWAFLVPVLTLLLWLIIGPTALALLLVYPAQIVRRSIRIGPAKIFSWQSSFFIAASKFPELQGVLKFHIERALKKHQRIIEYK